MPITINCSLFDNYFCTSEKNKKSCDKTFYKCSKINTFKYYDQAIANFNSTIHKSQLNGNSTRTKDFERENEKCEPRLNGQGIPQKNTRNGGLTENNDEDFICRCYYLCYSGKCTEKNCTRKFAMPNSEYKIVGYQAPPTDGSCGKVDLTVQKDNELFLTEVKPPIGNNETLLRMIAEILHHFYKLKDNKKFIDFCKQNYKINGEIKMHPAIMFFDGSAQQKEYMGLIPKYQTYKERIRTIIKEYNITVFCCDKKTKIITKLN